MSPATDNEATDFGIEVCQHLDVLYRTARHLLRSESDAEDLVQDAVLRALEKRHLFRRGTNMRAWLLTIMTRLHINRHHQTQRRPQVSMEDMHEFDLYTQIRSNGNQVAASNPAQLAEQRFESEDIRCAIADLPEEFRSVVVLSVLNECSYAEIAEVLQIPLGTVRSRLSRGRSLLRRSLWQYAEEAAL